MTDPATSLVDAIGGKPLGYREWKRLEAEAAAEAQRLADEQLMTEIFDGPYACTNLRYEDVRDLFAAAQQDPDAHELHRAKADGRFPVDQIVSWAEARGVLPPETRYPHPPVAQAHPNVNAAYSRLYFEAIDRHDPEAVAMVEAGGSGSVLLATILDWYNRVLARDAAT